MILSINKLTATETSLLKIIKLMVIVLSLAQSTFGQSQERLIDTKQGMTVSWYHESNRIFFELKAATQGWVAIGFNPDKGLAGTYLLMARLEDKPIGASFMAGFRNGQAEVLEHFTTKPGEYHPLSHFGVTGQVDDISGMEINGTTTIKFSLPQTAESSYQKDLTKGLPYHMLIAYSRDDDFQHHSIMRTSQKIIL